MSDEVAPKAELHRRLARDLFNTTWDLIDKADRSADEDDAMFLAAVASRWHWGQVGTAQEIATGDWQVAHVASLLGYGDVALRFAQRNLAIAEREAWDGWRLASAHEGMARAYAAFGDAAASARHVRSARDALERKPSTDDRQVVEEQLASLPPLR